MFTDFLNIKVELVSIISSKPSGFLIQSSYGEKGNFEVVAPLANGNGFANLWRDNDKDLTWNQRIIDTVDGQPVGKIDSISLVQANNFGTPGLGDFNAIARIGDQLQLFWMSDITKEWHRGELLPGSGYSGNP